MFRFEDSIFLYGLLLIPVLAIVYWLARHWKNKMLTRFSDHSLIKTLIPDLSKTRPLIKLIVFLLAYVMLIVGLANPQIGTKIEKAKRKGIDLVLALDVSNSMLAEDIQPNRLERAKQATSKLIDRLEGDRIGIVVFAGKAYKQLPITTDYAAAKLFLSNINTDIVPTQGTAIGQAIELALESFEKSEKRNKAIIVISDGENHEDNAIEVAKNAVKDGIVIHTIGMGTATGSPIPIYQGHTLRGYKKDREGNTVISRLDPLMLEQIAAAGNGIFVSASNTDAGLNRVFDEINKMEKAEIESKTFSDYEDRFQYFIAIAIFLIISELLIFEKKGKFLRKMNIEKLFTMD